MPYCGEVVHPLKGIFAKLGKLEAFDFSRVRVHTEWFGVFSAKTKEIFFKVELEQLKSKEDLLRLRQSIINISQSKMPLSLEALRSS